jgi:hypothetical protein
VNEDAYAPLSEVAALARVEPGTVRHWRYRGWIDGKGNRRHVRVKGRLYCAADVLRAEADTYVKSQSNRERKPIAA